MTFSKVANADSYLLAYREIIGADGAETYGQWYEVGGINTPYAVTDLPSGRNFQVKVGASFKTAPSRGRVGWSSPASSAPDTDSARPDEVPAKVPANVAVVPVVRGFIVSWDPISNADHYTMRLREVTSETTVGRWMTTWAPSSPAQWLELAGNQQYELQVGARFGDYLRV